MKSLETKLAEIKARAEAATSGPWEVDAGGYVGTVNELPVFGTPDLMRHEIGGQYKKPSADLPNMNFIANARQDIPALLRLVEVLREQRDSNTAFLLEAAAAGYGTDLDGLSSMNDQVALEAMEGKEP